MADKAIIVGAGVVGCLTALALARRGLKVKVLEAGDDIASGATKANSGIVHAGFDAMPNTLKARFNIVGNAMYDGLCRELDVPFKRNGSLVIAFGKEDEAKLRELQLRGESNGVETKLLTRDELLAREPKVSPDATAALFAPTGGITCPYTLAFNAAKAAAMLGAEFEFNVKDVHRVRPYEHGLVFNCAGIHADEINNAVSAVQYRIVPRRGQYLILDRRLSGIFNATIFQCPSIKGKGVLVSPTVDGNIIVGPTAEEVDSKEDTATTREGLESLIAIARKTYPGLDLKDVITEFSGLRAHEENGDFVIGEAADVPGFYNALGIESPGLTAAPAIAEYFAKVVCGDAEAAQIPRPCERKIDVAEGEITEHIICRCESITEAQIRAAIRGPVGARTLAGVKLRTRARMGRCQGGFCTPKIIQILAEELGGKPEDYL